jgi:hypothetical protein
MYAAACCPVMNMQFLINKLPIAINVQVDILGKLFRIPWAGRKYGLCLWSTFLLNNSML